MRDRRIDIMKGLAIVLMVLGHSGVPCRNYIYLFHMAAFFMISGYLFHEKFTNGWKDLFHYFLRKVKGIWLPYFIWNALFTICHNIFLYLHIYAGESYKVAGLTIAGKVPLSIKDMAVNIIKGIFMVGRTEMGGAFWFLRTLFALSILFGVIEFILVKLIRKNVAQDIVRIVIGSTFLLAGFASQLIHIKSLSIPVILSCYPLYLMGYFIRKYELMKYVRSWIAILIGGGILVIMLKGPGISLGDNEYGNPAYLLVCSLAGFTFLYGICDYIYRVLKKSILHYIGRNTLPIVILHFLCMKLVTLLQIGIYGYTIQSLAAFPYLRKDSGWWILYGVVGVLLPVLLNIFYQSAVCGTVNKVKIKLKKAGGGQCLQSGDV